MTWQVCPRTFSYAPVAASLFACAVSSALAGEVVYCVTCTNPDQTYACRVNAGGSKPSDALKLYCIIRTAKEGHHSSCSAESNSSTCNGLEKVYSYDGPLPSDFASDPHVKHFVNKIEQDQKAFEKPEGGNEPKTLVEFTGRAVSASRQGLRTARSAFGSSQSADQPLTGEPLPLKQSSAPLAVENTPEGNLDAPQPGRVQRASNAVSGFARKSYRCVLSFFRNCGGE